MTRLLPQGGTRCGGETCSIALAATARESQAVGQLWPRHARSGTLFFPPDVEGGFWKTRQRGHARRRLCGSLESDSGGEGLLACGAGRRHLLARALPWRANAHCTAQ
ncbi:unnamed protein product [Prorocentrum cordatum]|uniref:Uncharacterized protein n=1 Tax=Prorocentrum cordatum TaxID=2364126 RepID=A0ABN9QP20_9DINO|nr:unnamed protein product [Polarella glacialis]